MAASIPVLKASPWTIPTACEGDNDAAVFVVGLIVGAACAHTFGMASSTAGIGPNGMLGALGGLAVCLLIGFFNCKRGA